MQKILISISACVVLLLVSVYVFIPDMVSLKANIAVKATRPGLNRMLLDKNNVAMWWPGKIKNDSFYIHSFAYTLNKNNISVLPIAINGQKLNLSTSLFFIPILTDSTQLEWVGTMATSYNPFKRLLAYFKAREINNSMSVILQQLKKFYELPKNIYGFDIKKELVADSLLIATSENCNGYPTNEFIYSLLGKLSKYAASQSANQTGFPMLNINTTDSITYNVKVALPIDKALPPTANILQKRMLGRGNILVTEVKGGTAINNIAFAQIKKYADDYQRTAPAIPFYSLITDRLKEPDSIKWVTRIYFPVM